MQDIEALYLKRSLAEKTVKDQKLKIARMQSCHDIYNKKMQEKVDSANKATDYAIDLLNSDEDKFNWMVGTTKQLNDKNKQNKKQAEKIAFYEQHLGVIDVDELDND